MTGVWEIRDHYTLLFKVGLKKNSDVLGRKSVTAGEHPTLTQVWCPMILCKDDTTSEI